MSGIINPSPMLAAAISAVMRRKAMRDGIEYCMSRVNEFPSPLAAKLAGIHMQPDALRAFNDYLDTYWDGSRSPGSFIGNGREVIIGSGFHAATYAASRVLNGGKPPIVIERKSRVGGIFATSLTPAFYLNSGNRPGPAGFPGEGNNLNALPGAPIQVPYLTDETYPTNADMAFVVRVTLAQYATVYTGCEVTGVDASPYLYLNNGDAFEPTRVIDCRGLGDGRGRDIANADTVQTFCQWLESNESTSPYRGLDRVAVIGGGNGGNVVVESLLGLGPRGSQRASALDYPAQVDWYGESLPTDRSGWLRGVERRYWDIGQYLPGENPRGNGANRLRVSNYRGEVMPMANGALVNGRQYDRAIICTGYTVSDLGPGRPRSWDNYRGGSNIARRYGRYDVYAAGPICELPFTDEEYDAGYTRRPSNSVSMFRLSGRTSALAMAIGNV